METNNVKVQVAPGGPLLVNGSITLVDTDGKETTREGMTALCRCGASNNKPFCDGAHKILSFDK